MIDRLPHEKGFHVSWDQIHRDSRALAWRLDGLALRLANAASHASVVRDAAEVMCSIASSACDQSCRRMCHRGSRSTACASAPTRASYAGLVCNSSSKGSGLRGSSSARG